MLPQHPVQHLTSSRGLQSKDYCQANCVAQHVYTQLTINKSPVEKNIINGMAITGHVSKRAEYVPRQKNNGGVETKLRIQSPSPPLRCAPPPEAAPLSYRRGTPPWLASMPSLPEQQTYPRNHGNKTPSHGLVVRTEMLEQARCERKLNPSRYSRLEATICGRQPARNTHGNEKRGVYNELASAHAPLVLSMPAYQLEFLQLRTAAKTHRNGTDELCGRIPFVQPPGFLSTRL